MKRYTIMFLTCLFMLSMLTCAFAHVSTGEAEISEHFVYDKDFRTAAMDPDVIVLCPMEGSDFTLSGIGNAMQEEGNRLASTLGGRYECKTGANAVFSLLEADLTEFGTVLITTHGAKFTRGDGSVVVCLGMFREDNKDVAEVIWKKIIESGTVDTERCVNCIEEQISVTKAVMREKTPYLLFREVSAGLSKYYEIILTTNYFMDRYADAIFPNTLFYFNACDSYGDAQFQNFLAEHGVPWYLGYKNEISIPVQWITNHIHGFMGKWTRNDEEYQKRYGYAWRYTTINDANKAFLGSSYCDGSVLDINFTYMGMGYVRGKVVDGTSGEGLSGVSVHAWRYWNGGLEKTEVKTTDENGSYEFNGLPWGMYLLQAEDGKDEGFLNISLADADLNNNTIAIEKEMSDGPEEEETEGDADEDSSAGEEGEWSGDASGQLKGILYVDRPYYTEPDPYSPSDIIIYSGDVNIYALDPETGISELVRSFPVESAPVYIDLESAAPFVFDGRGHGSYTAFSYDENYERMSIDMRVSDGSRHVGWMDEYGNVTDVTELTMGSRGDFAGLPYQFSGCFGPDNYFYWYEEGWIPYRVPMDNLTPEAVESVEQFKKLYPDGTVFCQDKMGSQFGTYYTSASMNEVMQDNGRYVKTWSHKTNAWLQNGSFIEQYEDTIRRVNSDGSVFDIVPDIKDRWNINPVISPDKSRVAFISSLRTRSKGVDHAGYVFVVPSGGGDPVKISSEIRFPVVNKSYCYLLEWR